MKCAACGYRKDEACMNQQTGSWEDEVGGEDFIELNAAQVMYDNEGYSNSKPVEFSTETLDGVTIYACPKCGTLRVDL